MNETMRNKIIHFLWEEMNTDFGYSEFTENIADGITERLGNNFYHTDEMVFDLWQGIRSTNSTIKRHCIDKLFFDRFTSFLEQCWRKTIE